MSTAAARQNESGVSGTLRQDRSLLLELVAQTFDAPYMLARHFKTLRDVERTDPEVLRATPTDGTIFAPMVERLRGLGYAAEQNMGSVMDLLGLTQEDVHEIACACHWEEAIPGHIMGFQLRLLAVGPGGGVRLSQEYMARLTLIP